MAMDMEFPVTVYSFIGKSLSRGDSTFRCYQNTLVGEVYFSLSSLCNSQYYNNIIYVVFVFAFSLTLMSYT